MHDAEKVDKLPSPPRIQEHMIKMMDSNSRTNYFFTKYTVSLWNSLLQDGMMSTSLDSFKMCVGIFMEYGKWLLAMASKWDSYAQAV